MMTQQKYINSVKRKLYLPENLKKNILTDLQESFDTAYESGEDISAVISRLGTPNEFVDDILQNVEMTEQQHLYIRRAKKVRCAIVIFAVIALSFTLYSVIQELRLTMNGVIGYADAPTEIQITSDIASLLPIIGCVILWLVPIVLTIYLFFVKKQINK